MEEFLKAVTQIGGTQAKSLLIEDTLNDFVGIHHVLTTAARFNQAEIIEQLVVLGADVNQLDGLGMCALHYCAARNLWRAVSVLVNSDADVDLLDPIGRTPLMISIGFGHQEVFNTLVEITDNINAVDKNGNSALKIAIDKGLPEFVRKLIEKNASLNISDAQGWPPLFSAAARGNEEIFSMLVQAGANVEVKDDKGRNALIIAGAMGQFKMVEKLLEAGLDIQSKDFEGNNVLHYLAGQRQAEFVQYFKGHGENFVDNTKIIVSGDQLALSLEGSPSQVSVRSIDHHLSDSLNPVLEDVALIPPLSSDYMDLMAQLVQKGMQVNEQNAEAETPLHLAVQMGQKAAVESLLKVGADSNIQNSSGQTAMHLASAFDDIQNLIKNAQDTFTKTKVSGASPPPPAATAAPKKSETAEYILPPSKSQDRNSSGHTPLMFACATGNMKDILRLMKEGVDLDQKDFQGRTGLILAAAQGQKEVVSYLLKIGAKSDIKDSQGFNALAFAIANQHIETVKILVEHGCDVNGRLKGTPFLMIAISKGNFELTRYFLAKGALILEKDYRGATAVEYALASKSKEMIEFVKTTIVDLMKAKSKGR